MFGGADGSVVSSVVVRRQQPDKSTNQTKKKARRRISITAPHHAHWLELRRAPVQAALHVEEAALPPVAAGARREAPAGGEAAAGREASRHGAVEVAGGGAHAVLVQADAVMWSGGVVWGGVWVSRSVGWRDALVRAIKMPLVVYSLGPGLEDLGDGHALVVRHCSVFVCV